MTVALLGRPAALVLAGLLLCATAGALDLKDLGKLGRSASAAPAPAAPSWVLERPIDPESYRLGPGDLLGLYAYNLERTREERPVESDGRLELPGLGRVPAAGLSLAELRRRVSRDLVRVFACDSVDLWIAQPRRIRVQVGGAGQETRWLEMDYQSRLSATLAEAVRPPAVADPDATLPGLVRPLPAADSLAWRNVVIQRDGARISADLLHVLRSGSWEDDPMLEGGDRVIWSRRGATIGAWGPFRHGEGEQEFRPGDTPRRLVELMGGPRAGLEDVHYELVRAGAGGGIQARWTLHPGDGLFASLELQPFDRLYLRAGNQLDPVWQASVGGQVRRPGSYPVEAGRTTLADLLALARPDSATADLTHFRVLRKPVHDPETRFIGEVMQLTELNRFERDYLKSRIIHEGGRVSLTYDGAWFDPARVQVLDGDEIQVLRRGREVEVIGAVNRAGAMAWREGWSARRYVQAAGGKMRGSNLTDLRLRPSGTDQFIPVGRGYKPRPGDVLMLMYREELTAWQKFKEGITVAAQVLTVVLVARSF
ncbi:MAG: polysaccharide biosynthesis/export family protein [bacterium]|jgi:protein involved in polysaccharide export with SLBB domain|nr:polysaccharide biosynthesis/export family protein [bacterium]